MPSRRRRIGRKKSGAETSQPFETSAQEPAPTAEPAEPELLPVSVVPAEVETGESPDTAQAPEVFALVTEPAEQSPVDAWLTRARATVMAGAQPDWSDTEQNGTDDVPPLNGKSRSSVGDNPVEESDHVEDADSAESTADAEESEAEETTKRRRRGRKARRDKGSPRTKTRRRSRAKTAPEVAATGPTPFVPSFGFAAHPEYDVKWAAAAHWATIPLLWVGLGFLAPFFVLVARGEQSQFVRAHAAASLNFQLSLLIAMLLTGFLGVLSPLLFVIPILVGVLGATAAWFAMKSARASSEPHYLVALPIF